MNEPRDQAIDRLLKAELRSADASAFPPASPVCVDAETFAAWMEGTLPAQEAGAIEVHLSDCARCQALMAVFARTETAAAAAAAPAPRPWFLRWLAPAAAAAAVITIAVLLTRPSAPEPASEPQTQLAARSDAKAVEPTAPSVAAEGKAARQTTANEAGRLAENQAAKDDRSQLKDRAEKKEEPAKSRLAPPPIPVAGTASGVPGQPVTLTPPAAAAAAAVPPPAPPPPALQQPVFRAASGDEQRPANVIAEFWSNAPDAAPTAPAGAGRGGGARGGGSGRSGVAGGRGGGIVGGIAPGSTGQVRWRIYESGIVQRSADGTTWTPVTIDAEPPVRVTNGNAPSANVCWLVGRDGAVLISIDGGNRFNKLTFPERVDLISIRATDAREATVTTAGGRTFATTDGGISWVIRGAHWRPAGWRPGL